MSRKVAFIELHQETNSFSNLPTTRREFENFALNYGEDIWTFADQYKSQAYGFRQAIEKWGRGEFEMVPIYSAWAWSGGPIEAEVYEGFKREAVEGLQKAGKLAGVYVSLHGAMGVVGLRDPESDFLQAIREVVGDELPVAVTFDLHANVTQKNVDLATFIIGYRTNPHRDFRRTGRRAGELLIRTMRGEVKPKTTFRKLRLLKGGGWGIDFLQPMRGVLRKMKKYERDPRVLNCSSFWVHIWIDDEELGWSVLVTTDDDEAYGAEVADKLADVNWAVRHRKHPTPRPVEEAIAIARRSRLRRLLGTVVFCDVSDVVGAGAPGGNTNLLKALLEQAPELRSYVPVRDPEEAVRVYDAAQVGQPIEAMVGGRIDPQYNPVVPVRGEVIFREETDWGKTTILRQQGVHLILTELPFPAYFTASYKKLRLSLWKADVTVVKNLFPFRFRFLRYNRRTVNVVSRGITNVNVHQLDYEKIPRPIYPLDEVEDWRV